MNWFITDVYNHISDHQSIFVGGRLLGRTSSDEREESSETSEIDSGIREEEIDSAGDDNIEATTEDLKATKHSARDTASIVTDHSNR